MAVLVVFSFILGLIISTGLATTCNTVHNINKEENEWVGKGLNTLAMYLNNVCLFAQL